ncbi:hypothetical protein [Megasphaera coli]|uniref:hypothetical protein n=1 Tax=Colibacter massiliensis TaxID=1852379 RepID=UPI00094E6DDE|nr:hypothetical protein [Colibacter massiliensis]
MPVINYTEKFFNIKESYITKQKYIEAENTFKHKRAEKGYLQPAFNYSHSSFSTVHYIQNRSK